MSKQIYEAKKLKALNEQIKEKLEKKADISFFSRLKNVFFKKK